VDAVIKDQYLAIMNKSLHVDFDCPALTLSCDEQKIRIIVDNLLSNAVKFSPSGGKIRIKAEKDGKLIHLDIIDSGPGIEPDDRDRIFDPFYQGKRTVPTAGTGLGLSIAREYAKAHGGSLELMEYEHGAWFRLTLSALT
ncbi:MAG TPA: sensor histidine kinase, partial [Burkholderiales bacterium]|nr:sensor histidine kinase [Burkholderiales bacterium]